MNIETEMSPCDRCFNAIKVATEENITLKTQFGVYFDQPKERRNNPDADAKSDFIGEQGDIIRFLNPDNNLDFYFNLFNSK